MVINNANDYNITSRARVWFRRRGGLIHKSYRVFLSTLMAWANFKADPCNRVQRETSLLYILSDNSIYVRWLRAVDGIYSERSLGEYEFSNYLRNNKELLLRKKIKWNKIKLTILSERGREDQFILFIYL